MPENPQDKTKSVLQDFIVTKNNNPEMDSETLKSKFPEINQFAALNQVSSDAVVGELDAYYNRYRTGKFGNIDELNAASPFFFDQQAPVVETVEPTTGTTPAPDQVVVPDTAPVEPTPVAETPEAISDQVLKDFIVTKNNNPDMGADELSENFPEISQYANLTQQSTEDVSTRLNEFYNDYRSGEFDSFEDLSAKYDFAAPFKKKDETQETTGLPGETTGEPQIGQAESLETKLAKFFEPSVSDSEAFTSESVDGQNQEVNDVVNASFVMPSNKVSNETLDALYSDSNIPFINRMFTPTISVENEDGTTSSHLMASGEADGKFYAFPTLFEKDGEAYFPKDDGIDPFDYALETGNIKEFPTDEAARRFAEGEWKNALRKPDDTKGIDTERRDVAWKYRDLKNKSEGVWSEGLSLKQYNDFQATLWKEATDFWENLSPGERRNLIVDQQQSAEDAENSVFLDRSKDIIDGVAEKVSKAMNIPEDVVKENMPEMAMHLEATDPSGDGFFLADKDDFIMKINRHGEGNFVTLLDVRTQLANQYNAEIGEEAKQTRFDEILSENGGDIEAAQLQFVKEQDDIGFAFTPESDLAIRDLKDEIVELESKEFRTSKENLQLKNKQKELLELQESGDVGDDMFDPKTGEFVSGNTKDEEVIKFNDKLKENMAKYEKTDVGTLRKLRDDKYYQFQSYVNDFVLKTYPDGLSPLQMEGLLQQGGIYDEEDRFNDERRPFDPEFIKNKAINQYDSGFTGYRDFFFGTVGGGDNDDSDAFKIMNSGYWGDDVKARANDLLADYMAVNRMLVLNEDPGTIEEGSGVPEFFRQVGRGFKGALGVPSTADDELGDRSIRELEGLGYNVTAEQEQKLEKTLNQQVGNAVGSSIPISIEIGLNIALGNKLAGFAKLPKIFKALAGTSKAKKFGLTLGYDMLLQGGAFALSGEGVSAGVGEGFGQALGSALMNRLGVKNKMLNFMVRWGTGAVTETMAEYSGQFLDEMTENGYDWGRAAEETFGKTPGDAFEKLAVTYFTALTLGIGGSASSSKFLFDVQEELKASGSESPMVKAAIENDVTTPLTTDEIKRFEDIKKKQKGGEQLSDEDVAFAELAGGKEEFQKAKDSETTEEITPEVHTKEGGDTEYKVDDGFFSEEEVAEKLEDKEFVEKVKKGEVKLETQNPSAEVEEKIQEKFPVYKEEKVSADKVADEGVKAVNESDVEVTPEGEVAPAEEVKAAPTEEVKATPTEEVKAAPETKTAPEVKAEPAPEVEAETETKIEPDAKPESVQTETTNEAETKAEAEQSLDKVSEDVSGVAEGVAPFSTKKVFDSTINFAKNLAVETGLKGKNLIKELKKRLSEKIEDNFDPDDIDAISEEITEAVDAVELKADPAAEVVSDKKIKETSKKVADAIRKFKAPPDLGKLSSSPKPIFDAAWNTAMEATALAVEAGGTVVQAVSDGVKSIKKSDWFKGLSKEGKIAAEKQIKEALESQITEQESKVAETDKKEKIEKKEATKKKATKKETEVKKEKKERKTKEKQRQSKAAKRHAETLTDEGKKKETLDKTRYQVFNQEEGGKRIDELYDEFGFDGAVEYVNNPKNKVHPALAKGVKLDAAAKMISEGRRTGDIEMQERGTALLEETSLEQTIAGQQIAFIQEVYDRNPGLFWRKKLSQTVDQNRNTTLNQEHGGGKTVGEAIQETRDELETEMEGLREEIGKITEQLESALEDAKKPSARQDNLRSKKKKAKDKRAAGIEKFKKALKGKGGTANAGLDPLMIEGLVDIVASYIEEGITNTRLIISKTFNAVKNVGGNLTKENISNIAETLDEFKSLQKAENVNTFYEKVKSILNTKEEVDASTIDALVENPNSLWTQYQQNILSSVKTQITKMSNRAKDPKKKAELDKLSRDIAREINQKISEVSNSSKRRTKDSKSAKDTLIDLMANSDKIQEVYNLILSDENVSVEVKEAVMGLIESEVVFSNTLVSNMINEEAKLSGKKLADIVATHYSGKERFVGDLAETLVREAGLNPKEAGFVSDFLKKKMKSIIDEKAAKAVEKFLSKGISADDIQAAIDSGNIGDEIQKEIDRRLKTKENRKLIKRVSKAINMGALQDSSFFGAFADKFGFRDIDARTRTKFNNLVDQIEELRAPENTSKTVNGKEINTFQQERVENLERELNTLIDTLSEKNFAYVAENLVALKYFAILSGVSTQIRAMTGALLGAGLNTFAFGMRNVASMRGLMLGFANGFNAFKAASSRATLARKGGVISVGKGKGGFELFASEQQGGASKSKLSGVERMMLRGWSKAMGQFKAGQPVKGTLNAMASVFLQPLRMFHLLGASDAFFSSSMSQFIVTVQTYNQMARELKSGPLQTFTGMGKTKNTNGGVSDMSLVERTQQALAQNAESKATFDAIADEEYNKMEDKVRSEMRADGVSEAKFEREFNKRMKKEVGGVKALGNPRTTYKTRRKQELIENQNLEKFNYATGMVKDWLLIGTPDGIAGAAVKGVQESTRITPGDSTMKTLKNLLFQWNVMFLRLSANSWNQIKTGVPFLGALDAFMGYGVDPKTGEVKTKGKTLKESFDLFLRGKFKADRERSYQRLMVNTITTTAAIAVFQNMFDWDEDEEDYVLNPDRVIDVLGPGNFKQSENKRAIEDFQKFSFSISKNDGGIFDDYIRTNLSPQSQGMVAFLSAFSDDIRGLGDRKAIKEREGRVTPKFIKGTLNNPFQAWWEGSFNSMGRLIKSVQGEETTAESFMAVGQQIVLDNTKALMQPAIYRDLTKFVQSQTGGKQKSIDTFTGKFLNGFYGLDFASEERKDMFGNTYPVTDSYDQWITGNEKMSEKHKEVALLYKFEGGLEINPWRPTGFAKFGTFSYFGAKYETQDEKAQDAVVSKQEELFKEGVLAEYEFLNSIDNKDELETEMKRIRKFAIEDAKLEVVDKLIEDGLVVEITE